MVEEHGVTCHWPDGTSEWIGFDELRSVEIVTTSGGPFVEDVFFVLGGATNGNV